MTRRFLAMIAAAAGLCATAAAGQTPQIVSNAEAAALYERGAGVLFVDARTARERASDGKLPRALWVPFEGAPAAEAARIIARVRHAVDDDPDRLLIVLCSEGKRAAAVAELLARSGFTRVLVVAGGLRGGEPWLAFELEPN